MGLFTYVKLGRIKQLQQANLRQMKSSRALQEQQFEEQQQQNAELREQMSDRNRERIGKIRINVYNILKDAGMDHIKLSIGKYTNISANTDLHDDDDFFDNIYHEIDNQLYIIGNHIQTVNIVLYYLNDKIYINNGKNSIFGIDKIKDIDAKKAQKRKKAVQRRKREIAYERAEAKKSDRRFGRVWSIIITIFAPYITLIYYLCILLKNKYYHSNKSVWSNKQIEILLGCSAVWCLILIIENH